MSGVLPEDIIEENILTRLPVKSISRFRCVSKNWYHLFRNPNFIKSHLNHANLMNKFNFLVTNSIYSTVQLTTSSPFVSHAPEIDYPFMSSKSWPRTLGSSNGLVLMFIMYANLCVWNPATREYKPVPEHPDDSYHVAHGFGFDCKNDDYKILRIGCFDPDEEEVLDVSIYSLASNSWKELGSISYYFPLGPNKGFLLDGVLHWIVSGVLLCFDISDETFHEVPLPYKGSDGVEDPSILDLGVWEGKLCLFQKNHMDNKWTCMHQNDHIDVWMMMDNKWSKHLKITAHMTDMYYGRPIQTLQNGEILIEGGPREEEAGIIALISYDPKLERVGALMIRGDPNGSEVDTYILRP